MSRPNLGYSNYYWIRQDQKRLEKMRTTDTRTSPPLQDPVSDPVSPIPTGQKPENTGHHENPTGGIEAFRGDSVQKAAEGTQGSTISEPFSAAAPVKSNPEPDVVRDAAMPPAIMPVIPTWTKNITGN